MKNMAVYHFTKLNSLAPGRFEYDFRQVIFKLILVIAGYHWFGVMPLTKPILTFSQLRSQEHMSVKYIYLHWRKCFWNLIVISNMSAILFWPQCAINVQISVKFLSKYKTFHPQNCIWKYCLRNDGHFLQGEISYLWGLVTPFGGIDLGQHWLR